MSALSLTLPAPLDAFVKAQVRSGAYPDAEAVVRAGLDRLRAEADEDAAKEARFRALVQEGLDDFAAGRFETVEDVGAWLDGLGRRPAP